MLRHLWWAPVGVALTDFFTLKRVSDSGMTPSLNRGGVLLVNYREYRLFDYRRGDVVLFKSPNDWSLPVPQPPKSIKLSWNGTQV